MKNIQKNIQNNTKRSFSPQTWHFFVLLLTTILLQTTANAKGLENEFFSTFKDQRYVKTDLSSLKPQDTATQKLLHHVTEEISKPSAEDHFIASYLHSLLSQFDLAKERSLQINKKSPLLPLAKYYRLHFIARSSNLTQQPQDKIKQYLTQAQAIEHQLPTVLNWKKNATLAYFNLYKMSKTPKEEIDLYLIEQLLDVLQFSNISSKTKLRITEHFHQRIQGQPEGQKKAFYAKLPLVFPDSTKIKALIPSKYKPTITDQETRKPDQAKARQILQIAQSDFDAGRFTSALSYWSELSRDFAQTSSAAKAKKRIRSLLQTQKNKTPGLTALSDELTNLPPDLLYTEGRYLWNQNAEDIALLMFQSFIKKYGFHEKASNAYYIAARIFENRQDFPNAVGYYEKLTQQYPDSEFFARAHFKTGFLSYLAKDYEKAKDFFTKDLQTAKTSLEKAQSHYWLSKTFAATKNIVEKNKHEKSILEKYAFTYYGTILEKHPSISSAPSLPAAATPASNMLDQGIHLYLKVGLHDLVRSAYQDLDHVTDAQRFELAQRLDHMGLFLNSMNLAFRITENGQAPHKDVLKLFFPIKPYTTFFDTKKKYKAPKRLALSIMKQESAFNPLAVSHANAYGLMQLITPTAKKMARKNGIQIRHWDLFTPSINILLGTSYVEENLAQLDNHLPNTLIAYNAGPTRAKRWNKRWGNLDNDVYIEMIPFQETRTYVKLILRNIYFYKKLYPEHFQQRIDFKGLPKHFVK